MYWPIVLSIEKSIMLLGNYYHGDTELLIIVIII